MGSKLKDRRGQRNGRLVAIEPAYEDKHGWKWKCQCDCGNTTYVYGWMLKTTKSCGCLSREKTVERQTTHGKSKSRLMPIWLSMKQRCFNPKAKAYKHYGARGITVCDEWKNSFEVFEKWAIENGYDEKAEKGACTLDRIDVNGNYEPGNCRWISIDAQSKNKRSCVYITHNGETLTIAEWSRKLGIPHATISGRLRNGRSIEEVLSTNRIRYKWQDQ